MVRFGFHMNISPSLSSVPGRAQELECRTIQIFSRNPRGWEYQDLDRSEVLAFREKLKKADIDPLVIHMPYLPNPASPDREKFKKSLDSLKEELRRAGLLHARYVNVHIGKSMDAPLEQAMENVAVSINTALEKDGPGVIILLENTAGQGTEIGSTFEQIKFILDRIRDKERIGVCLDTAHLFGAGYDLRDKEAINQTFRNFDRTVGLKYLHCIHYNDSKAAFNSRVDRHWHIGKGEIGRKGMQAIIRCSMISHLPFIMETPKDSPEDDLMNLKTVKGYLRK
ncbi:MAG: deoxyribonuclease IV [bacterium]|nr:deoxyribonuclease IV [bacterium]